MDIWIWIFRLDILGKYIWIKIDMCRSLIQSCVVTITGSSFYERCYLSQAVVGMIAYKNDKMILIRECRVK